MKSNKKKIIRGVVFLIIFAILVGGVQEFLEYKQPSSYRGYAGFYQEPENSMDAVYIGSSNCYTFWNSLAAWNNYGIAIYPFAAAATSFHNTEYIIKEARKTQPNAVFIVNINTLERGTIAERGTRYTIDSMPLSWNKLALAHHICEVNHASFSRRLEIYLSIITYHSRWSELTEDDFTIGPSSYKGTNAGEALLQLSRDLTKEYVTTDDIEDLSEEMIASTDSLLAYLEKENIPIVFVTVPQARGKSDIDKIAMFHSMEDYLEEHGYPVLSLINDPEEVGIDVTKDYYNGHHTNLHGSLKFTYYLSEYLIDKYGFEDKRNDEAYRSWDESYERYLKKIKPFVMEHELVPGLYDKNIEAPIVTAKYDNKKAKVRWNSVKGADGYLVFRKKRLTDEWTQVLDTRNGNTFSEAILKHVQYYYTVVPYREQDGKRYFGNYQYNAATPVF